MIQQLSTTYPVDWLCELLQLARSSYYYEPVDRTDDPELVTAIEDLLANRPYLGYRMIIARLKQQQWDVSERPVRRILRQMGRTRSVGRVITTDSGHKHLRYPNAIAGIKASYPNHIWVADITYLRYGRQFVYLAIVLDLHTRTVRGWQLEEMLTCNELTLPALKMALQTGSPAYFHSDQGKQYAAAGHVKLLKGRDVIVSMSDAGQPTQNAFVERFIRTLKYEHVLYTEYESYADMRRQLKHFLEVEYNCERPHSALGYMTPLQFEQEYYWQQRFN